ncbi:hypothetical protein [Ruegeria arenilitoris]|uniref:Uncharacterized protein n=1 Tax=Ruegeria arenilitoris TaxID=1173585 RepID=A0A238K152_9RHOB|nr:hypothetical protein [Ruegeria arenilitoris]SMX36503.1 hypothetical protein RUA8715_01421 [Ruegeria arenilitoris]
MFTITVPDLQACLRVSSATPKGWLGDCPRERTGPRYAYRLPDILPRIRERRPRGLSAAEARSLVEVDRVKRSYGEDTLYLGEDARERAQRLVNSLTESESERLAYCQSQFTAALVERLLDREVFTHIEFLRLLLALHPDILAYVMTADDAVLPDWRAFAPAFAVINAPESTPIKEAA